MKNHKNRYFTWNMECSYDKPKCQTTSDSFQKIPDSLPKPLRSITDYRFMTSRYSGSSQSSLFSVGHSGAFESSTAPKRPLYSCYSQLPNNQYFFPAVLFTKATFFFFLLMFRPVSYCQGFPNQASSSSCLCCSKLIHLPCFLLSFSGLSQDITVTQKARTESEVKSRKSGLTL